MKGEQNYNRLMNGIRNKIIFVLTLFLIVAFIATGAIYFSSVSKRNAQALTSPSSAVLAGNGAEMWDSVNNKLNFDVVKDLKDKLFGSGDPVNYIKTNGADDYNTYHQGSQYYVVPASVINASANINNSNGLVVKIGGQDWMVASLTLADSSEDVIVTLYAANAGVASLYQNKINGIKENNTYSSSIVRNSLLTDATWSLFSTKGSNTFAERFLVQPQYVKYQEFETSYGRQNPFYDAQYNLPNDAYGSLNANWSSSNYQPSDTSTDPNGAIVTYDAWKEDYIWLPSATETGATNALTNSSIWRLSSAQLAHNASNGITWLRSGNYHYYQGNAGAYSLTSSGNYNNDVVTRNFNIRPAIHLNLSKLNVVETPKVTANYTYNITAQTVDFTDSSKVSNFDLNKMEITGVAPATTLPAGYTAPTFTASSVTFTEAGTYNVSLKSKPINASTTECWDFSTTGTDTATVTFIVAKKTLQKPSFGAAASAYTKDYDGSVQTFTASNYPNANVTGIPRDPLSAAVTKTNGAMVSGYTPTTTANSDNTLSITARNAGDYKATFTIADAINYVWWDNSTGAQDVPFYVKPKQLALSDNGASGWSWGADKTAETRTVTVSGLFNGGGSFGADSVDLQLRISDTSGSSSSYLAGTDNNDGTYTFVIDKDIAMFGGSYVVGSFYVSPVLGVGGGGTHDANYSFTNALASLNGGNGYRMIITAAGAGLSSYDLIYSSDDGDSDVAMTNGKVQFKYKTGTTTGAAFTVTMEPSQLVAAQLRVDTTYNQNGFVNGYKGNVAGAVGSYTGYARLHSDNPNALFNGTSTDADVAFTFEITKADFDFSNVKWVYTDKNGNTSDYPAKWNDATNAWEYLDASGSAGASNPDLGIPWYGESYTLTLAGLPSGITVNTNGYTGNSQKAVKSNYYAICNVTYDTNNFNAPSSALLNFAWSIVKGKVTITLSSWTSSSQGDGSNIFYVPTLQNVQGIDYEYYDLGTDTAPIAVPGNKLNGLSEILCRQGEVHNYYVKAVIKQGMSVDGRTLWSDAIEIDDQTGGGIFEGTNLGDGTKWFFTGDDRTPVQVSLNNAPFTYDSRTHAVLNDGMNNGDLVITVGGNAFPASNFTVNYYKYDSANSADHNKGTQLTSAPVDAGRYVIEIRLTATAESDYYATDEYLEFEINPFVLDMSQVKWGYVDSNGNEVAYNPSLPLQFELDAQGNPVEHKLVLIGMPKGDVNGDDEAQLLAQMFAYSGLGASGSGVLTYSGNTGSAVTNAGSLTATCTIDTNAIPSNVTLGSLPYSVDASGIATASQGWNIDPKKINTPKSDSTHSFTGSALDILSFAGLDPTGLGVYYDIVGLTKRDAQNNPQSLFTAANCADPNNPTTDEVKAILANLKDAGRYGITVKSCDSANIKFVENGVIGTLPTYSAQVTVNKLKITVVGWQGDGNAPWQVSYSTSNFPADVIVNRFVDENGNVVEAADLINHYNEQFTQTVVPSAGNEDNVEVEFLSGVDSEKTFLMLDQSNPPDPITKPSTDIPAKTEFNGESHSFLPSGIEQLVADGKVKLFAVDENGVETEVDASYFNQTNAGKYKVAAKIVGNYYWDGTNYDKTPIIYEFEVEKAKIAPVWSLDENGKPVASLPEGLKNINDAFVYHYYDGEGNEIAESDLKAGGTYTIGVTLKDGLKPNAELVDNGGVTVDVSLSDEPYVHPQSGFVSFMTKKFLFGLPMWLWLIIFLVLLILLIVILILIIKASRKHKEKVRIAKEKQEEEDRIKREKQEERDRLEEEKRRKEEEREEEKRRREEEREEEKRRREEEREDERRRREDERRASAMGMTPAAGFVPQQPIVQQQPVVQQPVVQPQPTVQPAAQPTAQQQTPPVTQQPAKGNNVSVEEDDVDAETYIRLKEYDERLRNMERELQERRMEAIVREENEKARKELEDAARIRRHEEEMQRLRDLQGYGRRQAEQPYVQQPPYAGAGYGVYPNAAEIRRQQQDLEMQRLRMLEDQIRQKERENQILQEQLRQKYGMTPPYGASSYNPYSQSSAQQQYNPYSTPSSTEQPPYPHGGFDDDKK